MTTSTPPAWHWLDECEVPVAVMDPAVVNKSLTTDPCPDCGWRHKPWVLCHEYANAREALSADSCNLSDSDASRVQNDSPDPTYHGCLPSERYLSDVSCSPDISCGRKDDAPGCDEAAKVTNAQSNAVKTYVFPEIGQFPGQKTGSEEKTHEDLQGKDADSFVVTSCPECGGVTDIDYGTVKDKPPDCQGYGEREADKVPFSAQEWMFESLCEVELVKLHDLIDDHHDLIIEMARDRFRDGYKLYGSTMYSWSPERRLDETLQELADATVYPTSGPMF